MKMLCSARKGAGSRSTNRTGSSASHSAHTRSSILAVARSNGSLTPSGWAGSGEYAAAIARRFTTAWSSPPIFVSRTRRSNPDHQAFTPPAAASTDAALGNSGR